MSELFPTLPCGCRRGDFLCPTAVALWDTVAATYSVARSTRAADDWRVYEEARAKYEEHFTSQEVDE